MSHQRKVKSYEVECYFYQHVASKVHAYARIPKCLGWGQVGQDLLLILEDLDSVGYGKRKQSIDWNELLSCLKWLAHFHATFMGEPTEGLWQEGTYWHLETRPDELKTMEEQWLKEAAHKIDQCLKK